VLLARDDVMGDGVNVAARVQAAAPPGGICISQDVFGVVKNKMKLDVIRLEPRQLKNINEPVQMYHVLLHPPTKRAQPLAEAKPEPAPLPEAPTFAAKKWIAVGVGVLVAGGVGFARRR
jgi:adenylate cyclase